MRRAVSGIAALAVVLAAAACTPSRLRAGDAPALAGAAAQRPNIVLVYADDLGYGDVSAYGHGTLHTPRLDQLAAQGLRLTDAHTAAATCTPSRYALMTGEYAFRRKGTGVLPGDAAALIVPGRPTLPSMLKQAGYETAIVGKWHLGLGVKDKLDWNTRIAPGPNEVGFDHSFIMAATGDRVPTVYVENGRVVGLEQDDPIKVDYQRPVGNRPTGREHPELLRMRPSHGHDQTIINGISRIGYMAGGEAALWNDQTLSDTFTAKAVSFIESPREAPFFLFLSMHEPHVPRVPHPRFEGASGQGPRGDAIRQFDANMGVLLDALERRGIADNTLVIVTSDNGPVADDGYRDQAVEKLGRHRPNGPWRGGKYSNFEGGTRVATLVRWPGKVPGGAASPALVGQVDLFASLAALVGQPLPPGAAPDSRALAGAWLGQDRTGRDELVEQAGQLALRQGQWKYIQPGAGHGVDGDTATELGDDPRGGLYDLATDPGETRNLIETDPARAQAMAARLQQIRSGGAANPAGSAR